MTDTSKVRKALIVNNLAEKDTSKNARIEIRCDEGTIPIAVSQLNGIYENTTEIKHTAEEIDYNVRLRRDFTAKRTDDKVTNALYDPDMQDRFVYIGHAKSIMLSEYNVVWYDAKYGDILILPDLETYGDANTDSDLKVVERIIGCTVFQRRPETQSASGRYSTKYNVNKTKPEAVDQRDSQKFPTPNVITGIATYLMPFADVFPNHTTQRTYMRHDDYFTTTGNASKVIEVISLGSSTNLFGDAESDELFSISAILPVRSTPTLHQIIFKETPVDDVVIYLW